MSKGKDKVREFKIIVKNKDYNKEPLDIGAIKRHVDLEFYSLVNEIIEDFVRKYKKEDLIDKNISLYFRVYFPYAMIGFNKFLLGEDIKEITNSLKDILEFEFERKKVKLLKNLEKNKDEYNGKKIKSIEIFITVENVPNFQEGEYKQWMI